MAWNRVSSKRQRMVGTSFKRLRLEQWSKPVSCSFGWNTVQTKRSKVETSSYSFVWNNVWNDGVKQKLTELELYTLCNRRSPARLSLRCKSEGQLSESTNNLRPVWSTVNTNYHILFLNNNETLLLRVYFELPHSQKTSNWPRIIIIILGLFTLAFRHKAIWRAAIVISFQHFYRDYFFRISLIFYYLLLFPTFDIYFPISYHFSRFLF